MDLETRSIGVVFDPALTTVDALRDAVARAGYPTESETVADGQDDRRLDQNGTHGPPPSGD
ncbi:MAG: heavy-metal-associated domain-containing protein [Actinomycetota bacterium]|nr:heavy-metal-associated domain-containing protein [Actinomycetota bacterium]